MTPSILTRTLGAVLLCAALNTQADEPTAGPNLQVALNIKAQPVREALQAFGEQTGLQVLFRSEGTQVEGVKAAPVSGELPAGEALGKMLAKTGLKYEFVNDRTVRVAQNDVAKSAQENSDGKGKQGPLELARAQEESPQTRQASERNGTNSADFPQSPEIESIDEVLVTGTHIRGETPAGSRVIVISKQDIEQSGRTRLQDLFETLPQNFSGSGSVDSTNGVGNNANYGTGIDLRGLGTGTTLVLVNGRRQPGGDLYGSMTDISTIPSAFIERVEILTDGASALYGSDAIGGVVNLILRKDYDGAETSLRFSSLDGNADEVHLSQLFGTSWSGGNAMIGYQYQESDPLLAEDVPYRATLGDQTRFGGTDLRQNFSTPGVILNASGQPAYAIPRGPRGQNGSGLTFGDLTPLNGVLPAGYPLNYLTDKWQLPQEKVHAVFLRASQQLNDRLELFAEGRYGERNVKVQHGGHIGVFPVTSTNPFYPSGATGTLTVAYNFYNDGLIYTEMGDTQVHSETAGIVARLGDWQATFSGFYGQEKNEAFNFNDYNSAAANAAVNSTNPNTALNVFGDGANNPGVIDAIRASNIDANTMQIWGGGVIADGPLATLFDRQIRLALGADYRAESLDFFRDFQREFPLEINADRAASEARHISAAFAELAVPLVPRRLEMSLAGRYEDYSDFGTTFNPKIGLRWQPVDALQLRGTWGTSFKAPKLIEIAPGYTNNLRSLTEVSRPNPAVPGSNWRVLSVRGPNPGLHEETADVWTVGFDFAPKETGLKVSMSYFDIDYSDKIAFVGGAQPFQSLQAYTAYADFITVSPSAAQVDALCSQFPGVCTGRPIGAIFNSGLANLSKVLVSGVDFDVSQSLDALLGTFDFGLGGTRISRYDRVVVSGTPVLDVVNTFGNPLALRLRGKLSWSFKGWRTGLFVNYTNSYDNPGSLPVKVDAWTTVDLSLGYRMSSGPRWLAGSRFSFSVLNVTDELPPFINTESGYDADNADITGRRMSLQFIKEW